MSTVIARDVAARLSLKKHQRSWRGDCPSCSYRGAFAVKEGAVGAARLFCANGCAQDTLLEEAARITGGNYEPKPATAPTRSSSERSEYARRLWVKCRLLADAASEPGRRYLQTRRIDHVAGSPELRFHEDVRHPEGGSLAAVIALARNLDGEGVGLQRIYLTRDGSAKAAVTPQKAGLGVLWGAAVRLQAPVDGAIVVGEGVETSAAAGRLLGLPAWAAISAGNLATGLMLPAYIRRVIVASDHDTPRLVNGRYVRPGQDAAEAAARRWRKEGRVVEVIVPDKPGTDFADLLMEREHGR